MKKKILISSGGTGGHVIPATIFYEHLKNEFEVFLTIDKRGSNFLNLKDYKVSIIDIPKLNYNLLFLPLNLFKLFFSFIKSLIFLKKNKIDILLSTGGYMSVPLCIMAKILRIKIYLYEPNLVLGRANKILLKYCEKIFCYSEEIISFPKKKLDKISLINPLLRREFYASKNIEIINDEINLLIIGGSQGAKFFEKNLNKAIIDLNRKYKLNIYHQANNENFENLKKFYDQNKIKYKLFHFNENILNIFNKVNLCITRAGASSLAELVYSNIPFLAIPYPLAKDNHQYENALYYKNNNCCWLLEQNEVNDETLSNYLIKIVDDKSDYLNKKKNMEKISYKISWNTINQKIINTIYEN
tara:strand:- start:30 stop:1100 length:1071 start_codon:yes stop_codon:yes gene_type:complete